MNRQDMADELDGQVEMLLRGRDSLSPGSDPLLNLGAELCMLPSPEFRSQLKGELVEGWIANHPDAGSRNTRPLKGAKGRAARLTESALPTSSSRSLPFWPWVKLHGSRSLRRFSRLFVEDHYRRG